MNTTSFPNIVTDRYNDLPELRADVNVNNQLATLVDDYSRAVRNKEFEDSESLGTNDSLNGGVDSSSVNSSVPTNTTTHTVDTTIDNVVAPLSVRRLGGEIYRNTRSLNPISEWEGFVDYIEGNEFLVRMTNIQSGSPLPMDEATFQINELSDYQRRHLEVGAIVRWVIGMERLPSDQRRKVSELHFRRLPAHSNSEYQTALIQAKEIIDGITWDDASK